MKRFTSTRHAQRFLSAFSSVSPHFRPGRHRLSAPEWRTEMAGRFAVWREFTATDVASEPELPRPQVDTPPRGRERIMLAYYAAIAVAAGALLV